MKGGYKIINFSGVTFTSGTAVEVPSSFKQARNPYGKATLVSGLVVGENVFPEFFMTFSETAEAVTGTASVAGQTVTINVTADDDVTVTVG